MRETPSATSPWRGLELGWGIERKIGERNESRQKEEKREKMEGSF